MNHDINLNIHYSAPKEIWEKIEKIYESMPYWAGCKNGTSVDRKKYRFMGFC